MIRNFIFASLLCLVVQGCKPDTHVNINHIINSEFKKEYNLSRSDLIVSYDLGQIDSTDCIYSNELVLVINDSNYTKRYLSKFKSNFKSSNILRHESTKKVVKICSLLNKLHNKYNILSNNQYQYIKKLYKSDLTKLDAKIELSRLNSIFTSIPVLMPEYNGSITSKYGYRKHPLSQKSSFHCGLDIISGAHSPIYASANGKVTFAGRKRGYGNVIEITHSNNVKSIYAHLSSIKIKTGQKVARGVMIGKQGKSGFARGEHLHFEIRIKDKHVDPYDFIGHAFKCKI